MCSTTPSHLASPHISPDLPISPHISPDLPISPHISRCSTTLSYLTNVDAKSGGSHLGAKAAGPTPDQVSDEAISISRQLDEVNGVERMLVALVRAHGRLVSPHISPYLPMPSCAHTAGPACSPEPEASP